MRKFEGGATRDCDDDKLDFEGFLSPRALRAFAEYMHKHRDTADGLRDSDNWQRGSGIPLEVYLKSAFRHFFTWWELSRSGRVESVDDAIEALCALLFNVQGALHEHVKLRERQTFTPIATAFTRDYSYKFPEEGDDRAVRGMPERGEQGFRNAGNTDIPSSVYWDEPGQGGT